MVIFQSTLSKRRATVQYTYFPFPFEFQSTLSKRRATWSTSGNGFSTIFQSTLSKRRATTENTNCTTDNQISIHALQAESDDLIDYFERQKAISIHALQAESDLRIGRSILFWNYFNPRSPSGERRLQKSGEQSQRVFQSTLSKRRATISPFTPL